MGIDAGDGKPEAEPTGTTAEGTGPSGEQSVASERTTSTGTADGDVESFFDPESIKGKPELEAAYKSMQRAFTKRTSSLKEQTEKVKAYDAFLADPQGTLKNLAMQYGMTLMEGKPTEVANGEFAPKTWDEVYEHFAQQIRKDLEKEYDPLKKEVTNLKSRTIEASLDRDFPDWREYEDEMADTLQKHPTLINDPETLYEMAVPRKVREERAMQRAMKKLRGESDASEISDSKPASTTTTDKPTKALSFDEAVSFAKSKLKSQGLSAPVD